jgi:hypothetical protein
LSIAELAHQVRDTLAPGAAVHIAHGHDDKAGRNRYIPPSSGLATNWRWTPGRRWSRPSA